MFERTGLSSVDELGSVFIGSNKVCRGINNNSICSTQDLLSCGLIKELVNKGLFPQTSISATKIAGYGLVIEHEKISPVTYPFEWSPEMLRAAALCVLEVNEVANKYGYELKDCHPYNIVFRGTLPVFVDLGSFVKRTQGFGWLAHSEFLGSYYYPLVAKMKGLDTLYKKAFLISGYGIGLVEGLVLFNPLARVAGYSMVTLIGKIILSYKLGNKFDDGDIKNKFSNVVLVSIARLLLWSLVLPFRGTNYSSLEKKIKGVKLSGVSTWGSYQLTSGYYDANGDVQLSERMDWVQDQCKKLKPESITELAGNQGVLLRKLSSEFFLKRAVITDYDLYAIDTLYLAEPKNEKITLACFDFMNGTYGHMTSEERPSRLCSEMVIAMAVTHHLLLTQGYSIENILKAIMSYTSRYMVIEFMPLGLWDGFSAPVLPQWYTEEWFVQSLSSCCAILNKKVLGKNRVIYICEKS